MIINTVHVHANRTKLTGRDFDICLHLLNPTLAL